jgi:microcompartment protein CcmL/EutN
MNGLDQDALGIVETRGLVAAIEAADAMLKAARVRLVRVEKTVPALMSVQVLGETAAVRAAVDAGRLAAEKVGTVVSVHVIPRPADDTVRMQRLAGTPPVAPTARKPASRAKGIDPESMTVRELRALARTTPGLPIQGRAIARASKAELVAAFRRLSG